MPCVELTLSLKSLKDDALLTVIKIKSVILQLEHLSAYGAKPAKKSFGFEYMIEIVKATKEQTPDIARLIMMAMTAIRIRWWPSMEAGWQVLR